MVDFVDDSERAEGETLDQWHQRLYTSLKALKLADPETTETFKQRLEVDESRRDVCLALSEAEVLHQLAQWRYALSEEYKADG